MLIGATQHSSDFIGRSWSDRNSGSSPQDEMVMQRGSIVYHVIRAADGAQLAAEASSGAQGAHIPSRASTALCDGPEISRHMRGVGSIFCGFRIW